MGERPIGMVVLTYNARVVYSEDMSAPEVTISTLADEFDITTAEAWRRLGGWADFIGSRTELTPGSISLARQLLSGHE